MRGAEVEGPQKGALVQTHDSSPEVGPAAPSGGVDFGEGQPASAYVRQCPGEVPAVVKEMGLTRLIPLSVKERIWRKEYIDIFTLLEVRVAGLDLKAEKDEDKDKKRVRVERNIANWGQAFRTMACIIIEKFPECAGALWLYEYSIHAAHAKYQGDAWRLYDEGFRQKMQIWPATTWDSRDLGGFAEHMISVRESSGKAEQQARSAWGKPKWEKPRLAGNRKASPAPKAGKAGVPICWAYERGDCKWGGKCKYRHMCSTCEGGHPASDCRKGKQAPEGRHPPGKRY